MVSCDVDQFHLCSVAVNNKDKIFGRKRRSTGANFVHVFLLEIWDKGILKFSM